VEVALGEVVDADAAVGEAGRGVDVETGGLAEGTDAEKVGAIGDDDEVVEVVVSGDVDEALDLLLGVGGGGLGDDLVEGDAVGEEIVATYAALGVAGVEIAAAAEGDDEGRHLEAIESNGVVETGVEDRRGMAGVLGRSEDRDGVCGAGLVDTSYGGDLEVDPGGPGTDDQEEQDEESAEEVQALARLVGGSHVYSKKTARREKDTD